ncbi:unnamed protein product [Rotaria sordida]|uniref:Uncharacterized protein n=1 Tax=Rotaria sordida TaxID=392033 RepID=A0A814EEP6_9BILA|nr:unnamed protein product [Rotaria sordida]CAF3773384.1 unnamed protein product [Rotaria sordida]
MLNMINEWGDTLIRSIRQHVNKQTYRLEQEYDNEVDYLKQQNQLFINELYIREQTNTTEQIDQLLDRCKALKFELAALEYNQQPIQLIQVTRRESVNIKLDEFNVIERRNKNSGQNSLVDNKCEVEYAEDAYRNSYSTTTFANTQQTDTNPSTMNLVNVYKCPTSNDNGQNFVDARDYDLLEKCPTCFMIFPQSMAAYDRSRHVQEHYTDD